jgi:SNF2 family DNA or RNA helicase
MTKIVLDMFSKGQRICLKSNPERRGIVLDKPMIVNGYNIYSIMFDDGKQSTINEVDLMPEVIVESAWDKLANNLFGDHNNFSIASTINKIKNASANTISTLKASKTIFMPYQFIPLVKLLNSDNKRIIVADEVGLGKTIEAGHILLEFASRGQLNNFLIVCLNSIQEKWRDEMENKFNIRLKIYSSLKEFQNDLIEQQKGGTNIAGIINYDKFRNSRNSDFFSENAIALDLIVFDEAHTLRNKTNARNALENFTSIAKSIVMLTATPLMTGLDCWIQRNIQNLKFFRIVSM